MILDEETGQLVLDPNSLTLQAQAPEEYTRREEGDHDVVNSMTYMKKEAATRWSAEETEEFYAVRPCSTLVSSFTGSSIFRQDVSVGANYAFSNSLCCQYCCRSLCLVQCITCILSFQMLGSTPTPPRRKLLSMINATAQHLLSRCSAINAGIVCLGNQLQLCCPTHQHTNGSTRCAPQPPLPPASQAQIQQGGKAAP